jgi:hypothetical protein
MTRRHCVKLVLRCTLAVAWINDDGIISFSSQWTARVYNSFIIITPVGHFFLHCYSFQFYYCTLYRVRARYEHLIRGFAFINQFSYNVYEYILPTVPCLQSWVNNILKFNGSIGWLCVVRVRTMNSLLSKLRRILMHLGTASKVWRWNDDFWLEKIHLLEWRWVRYPTYLQNGGSKPKATKK